MLWSADMSDWTDDRVATLARLYADGDSTGQIAKALGGITRNAVIGKIARIGLTRPKKTIQRMERRPVAERRRRIDRGCSKPPMPVVEAAPIDMPIGQRCGILDLDSTKCRWPVGEVGTADFFYCGAVAVTDRPYCIGHSAIAFTPRYGR